jgi:hypothetical protein
VNIEKQTHPEFAVGLNPDIDASAERLTEHDCVARAYVRVQAASGNSGFIYVGHDGSVTASNGWELDAGEHIEIPVDSPRKIWVIGSEANQAAKWLAV